MARIKIVIREQDSHKTKDGTYNIKIRVTHQHRTRYIGTGFYVLPEQITDSGEIVDHPNAAHYNIELRNLLNLYDKTIAEIGGQLKFMEIKNLVSWLRSLDPQGRDIDFLFFAEKIARQLHAAGRISYAGTIEHTISEIKSFSGDSLLFSEITTEYLTRLQMSLMSAGKSANTTGIHLRNIRMIYNKAIDAGKVSLSAYPFRRFKIKQQKAADRDLDIEDLIKIKNTALKLKGQSRARDLFMLSFYLCGINFKDMLYAKKSDIRKGRLNVARIKTGQLLSIKIELEAQKIIDKYSGEKYMLYFMENKIKNASPERKTILHKDIISQVNVKLKKIAEDLKIPDRLSTYHARHSWASIAFNHCGVSEDIIALALGHASPRKITAGYIRKKYELVDKANRMVINAIE